MNKKNSSTVLDAIRQGNWYFEPDFSDPDWKPTDALPGSDQKIEELRSRIEDGFPLWHPEDRITYEEAS